ncbi:hypothetical protein MUN78_06880 [Leucobacter allii]|uniref:Uncharacterized protein n=1 Tax=Leucobacter allii TaxID=2932247 RepID=A0ABY4FQJ3_9MICO|nr:hypothetical protein [Leucobacter allii]UOQ58540.1 hypothetical protein MUN78_06880 [Leucobacter allii]
MDQFNDPENGLDEEHYAAWRRMYKETAALLRGDAAAPSADLPHVAAYLAAHARFQVDIHGSSSRDDVLDAHARLAEAEAQYIEAIMNM